jgi:formylglycine-generating enzyme required for sulfatase activity
MKNVLKAMVLAAAVLGAAAQGEVVLTGIEFGAWTTVQGTGVPMSDYKLEWTKALLGTDLKWYDVGSAKAELDGTFSVEDDTHRKGGFFRVAEDVEYLVVDMSLGALASHWPVTTLTAAPEGGWTDEYKTDKLVLRRVPAGVFMMGSPEGELGRRANETQHAAGLSEDFYVGLFEVTQRQWELATGYRPSFFTNDACYKTRPVERVSYEDIRGKGAGAAWPQDGQHAVEMGSFLYAMRRLTGLDFDLPTEAQWEYACRAGTTNALNSGKDLTTATNCPNMDEVGRYEYNRGTDNTKTCDTTGGTAAVGSYKPNAWGLYDMHGNVAEWCLDWFGEYGGDEMDPQGASEGGYRVLRGGGWNYSARLCRSGSRGTAVPSDAPNNVGLRLVCPVE